MNKANEWIAQNLEPHSGTVCAAKWLNSTIWLGNGMTASCHHPPPHKIDPQELVDNPSALHNTKYKKLVRKEMLEGKQTRECDYCWKMENLEQGIVSDRYYKSVIYDQRKLHDTFTSSWSADVSPETIEISFDSNCNFACSYCNAGYSTTWAKDIRQSGAYVDLKSDGHGAYAHTGEWAMPYGPANQGNPYIDAFWKWWESDLQYNLTELRVTGGEATVSNDFWRLIDWYNNNKDCKVRLAVNSNLGVRKDKILKLVDASKNIAEFDLYTSNEAVGSASEYIRDGLVWEQWRDNLETVVTQGDFRLVHVMFTIGALSLSSIDEFLDVLFELRERTGARLEMSFNILRFPSFQSITTLPKELREHKHKYLSEWFASRRDKFHDYEADGFQRMLSYIMEVQQGHSVREHSDLYKRQQDFYKFFTQYDQRRNLNFATAFANWPQLVEWFNSMEQTIDYEPITLVSGDATEWGKEIYNQVMDNAKEI